MSAASATALLRAALVTVSESLFPDAAVSYGPAGTDDLDDLVEWTSVAVDEREALLGPQRRRHHAFEAGGKITAAEGGGPEAQQVASERALGMLAALSDYVQDSGASPSTQVTLGGVVDWLRVSSFEVTDEEDDIESGRTTYIDFTLTGQITA